MTGTEPELQCVHVQVLAVDILGKAARMHVLACGATLLSIANIGALGCWVRMRCQQGLHELHRRACAHSPWGSSRRNNSTRHHSSRCT